MASQSRLSREQQIYRGTAKFPKTGASRFALLRLLTDFSYTQRVVRYALGLPTPLDTEDRRVLERKIFPSLLSLPNTQRILFVGCDWYTKHYQRGFFQGRDFWTIDIAPKAAKFGGSRHVTCGLADIDQHFAAGHFDLIVSNGVYGFGLDTLEGCESAIDMAWSGLRPGGLFMFGWDDIPARTPVPLDSINALQRFEPFTPPGFTASHCLTATPYRHTYDFFRKAL